MQMMARIVALLAMVGFAGATASTAAAQEKAEASLLVIRGQGIVAGILPDAGGRLVVLRTDTGKNWIDSSPAEWLAAHPEPTRNAPYPDRLRGVVVWAGPQSAFWADQELDAQRKAEKATWPPDPFGEWGHYKVQRQGDDVLVLDGPASPITGLRMTKVYKVSGPGELTMEVTATNMRDREVNWDLWPNARVDPAATAYVPLGPQDTMRVTFPNRLKREGTAVREASQVVSPGVIAGGNDWESKLFIQTTQQMIRLVRDGKQLVLRGSLSETKALHPEHTAVEIYRSGGSQPILEAEMHGAYRTLKPGESMSFTLTLQLRD